MWRGRLPRHILDVARRSYVARTESGVHKDTAEGFIDCGLGTNPLGFPPAMREVIRHSADCDFCDYPSAVAVDLQKAVVEYLGISGIEERSVVPGHGSIDILVTLIRLLLPPGSLISGVSPQFTDTPIQAMMNSVRYHPVVLKAPSFTAGRDEWMRAARLRPHVLYIDRPHNPTGQFLPLDDLKDIVAECAGRGCWVIVDEAYGDYLPMKESALTINSPNCIVTRGFAKAWGLAGLRVGYGVIKDPELLEIFYRLQPPFSVNTIAEACAVQALKDREFLERTRQYVRESKKAIIAVISEKEDLRCAETHPDTPIMLLTQRKGNLQERLAAAGISSEPGKGYLDLDETSVRLRVPPEKSLREVLRRLRSL